MKRRLLGLFATALIGTAAFAQGATSGSLSTHADGTFSARMMIQPPHLMPAAMTGAPYSADQVSEHTQTLADGTHISSNRAIEHLYRDSAGRTRTERPMFMGPNVPKDLPLLVEIIDPVIGVEYVLDSQNHVAHRYMLQPAQQQQQRVAPGGPTGSALARRPMTTATGVVAGFGGGVATASGAAALAHQESKVESLGTQTIEGVLAEGTRWITTYSTGSVGNDRPFSSTRETWMSPELHAMVLTKNNDPRSGENIMRLTNISRSEPDASLFQPPPDYRVVDETEAVTITFTRP